jgi:hypothetical protein
MRILGQLLLPLFPGKTHGRDSLPHQISPLDYHTLAWLDRVCSRWSIRSKGEQHRQPERIGGWGEYSTGLRVVRLPMNTRGDTYNSANESTNTRDITRGLFTR